MSGVYSQMLWKQYLLFCQCSNASNRNAFSYVNFYIENFKMIDCFSSDADVRNSKIDQSYIQVVNSLDGKLIPKKIFGVIFKQLEIYWSLEKINLLSPDADYVLHGISSLVITWNLTRFYSRKLPLLNKFLIETENFLRSENPTIYHYNSMFLYMSCALKVWKHISKPQLPQVTINEKTSEKYFNFFSANSTSICEHLQLTAYADFLYSQQEQPPSYDDIQKWNSICEQATHYPLKFPGYQQSCPSFSTVKYITGTACVGKSTLLRKLKDTYGWQIWSRGAIGTFAGKAKNALQIAGLHFALNQVLGKLNVIGDRGTLDNPLWTIIMDIIQYTQKQGLSDYWKQKCFSRFFELFDCFNEPALAELAEQNVVIIIDNNCFANKMRMRNRGTGNDLHRSAIRSYVLVQNLAYYICSKIFSNWKLICVPYRKCSPTDIDFVIYNSTIAESVNSYFSKVISYNADRFKDAQTGVLHSHGMLQRNVNISKVNTNLHPNKDYSQSIGIYK